MMHTIYSQVVQESDKANRIKMNNWGIWVKGIWRRFLHYSFNYSANLKLFQKRGREPGREGGNQGEKNYQGINCQNAR